MRDSQPFLFVRRFWKGENGNSTIEFAILFPLLITAVAALFWLGLYILTIANVQQLAHEVARQALQYDGVPMALSEFCSQVDHELVGQLSGTFALVNPEHLGPLQCAPSAISGWSEITLTYDASSMGFNSIFRLLNSGSDVIVSKAIVAGH